MLFSGLDPTFLEGGNLFSPRRILFSRLEVLFSPPDDLIPAAEMLISVVENTAPALGASFSAAKKLPQRPRAGIPAS